MTMLAEDDLQISLPAGALGRKFDDEMAHGLSHCMKAVDFIVELEDRILFVEFKDPDNPMAKAGNSAAFVRKFLAGQLDADLKAKYRDSWLYEWAEGRIDKPVFYLVLIASAALSEAELLLRTDALKRQIPLLGPDNRPWRNAFVAGCAVMNIAAWNRALPQLSVSRVSMAGQV